MSALKVLPLFNYGMAWLLPTVIALVAVRFAGQSKGESSHA
nr:hypothetical protein [Enterovibrio nigricans]